MGISVIGTYIDWLDIYQSFQKGNFTDFQNFVNQADEIIGFNSINFDDNLMKANGILIATTYDLLCEVRVAAGMPPHYIKGLTRSGYSLGALAETNLSTGKSGSGELAPMLWQEGKYQEVIDYCLNDVKLLVELYKRRSCLKDPTDCSLLELRA